MKARKIIDVAIIDRLISVERKIDKILEILPQSKEEWDTKIEQTVRAILDAPVIKADKEEHEAWQRYI